jgi:hypothetical protein
LLSRSDCLLGRILRKWDERQHDGNRPPTCHGILLDKVRLNYSDLRLYKNLSRTFVLLPKTASSDSDKTDEDVDLEKEKMALSPVEIQDISGPTIWETLQSASFMLYYYCYLILDSRIVLTFYLLPTMLDSVYEDEEDKKRISQLFTKANSLSFIICPLAGIIAG